MSLTTRITAPAFIASILVGFSASAWAQGKEAPSVEEIQLEAAYPKRSHLTMKIVTGARNSGYPASIAAPRPNV